MYNNQTNRDEFIALLRKYQTAYDEVSKIHTEYEKLAKLRNALDIEMNKAEEVLSTLNELICTDKENQHVYILGNTVFVVGPGLTDVYRGTVLTGLDRQSFNQLDNIIYTSELAHTTSDIARSVKTKFTEPFFSVDVPKEIFDKHEAEEPAEKEEAVISEDEAAPPQTENRDIKEELEVTRKTGWFGSLIK